MTLADLEHEEQLTLIGLAQMMIAADRQTSSAEAEQLVEVVDELGREAFEQLTREADELMQDEAAVRYYAERVRRPEAREAIFAVLFSLAVPDTISAEESDLLQWLRELWQLDD